ncbi:MAG: prepilin-type N-terminal cleavage/methylation domain-containing protein [Planctomycetota bacterium]
MKPRGFTLIEIMVVMSIMIMLAATLVAAGMYAHKVVMIKVTESIIANLSLAIGVYATDYNGSYPLSHQTVMETDDCIVGRGAGIQALVTYLFKNPALTSAVRKGKSDSFAQAKDFRKDQISFGAGGVVTYLMDAWGVPLYYYRPGAPLRNSDSFDLFSAGPNQKTSTSVFNQARAVIHDYRSAIPLVFKYTPAPPSMKPATGATGDPDDIPAVIIDPARDQRFDDTVDDVVNWTRSWTRK